MLRPIESVFNPKDYPDLLLGLETPDDAAVWKLDGERALVMTTDFFTPVVDDAYDYGAIAAANSISDIYAMGGQPFMALNIAAMPPDLPVEITAEIFRGGAEKAREAGVVIAGGHTVQDREPKYGLAVVGFVALNQLITKDSLHAGDCLVLTKPLGFGVTTTALKRQQAREEDAAEAAGWMKRLNRAAASLANQFGVRGGTDITGFSLLGHAWEMASHSGVKLHFDYERIPFLTCAGRYAGANTFPGGAFDNRLYFSPHVQFADSLGETEQMLLFDPQTSGGLLLGLTPDRLDDFLAAARELGQPAWEIGRVEPGQGIVVV